MPGSVFKTAVEISEELLEITGAAMLASDFDAFVQYFILPQYVETFEGHVLVATQEWLDFGGHGFDAADATIGLMIAVTKACLVAAIFMHLNHEKKWIYGLFGLGLIMAVAMVALIFLAKGDPIHYDKFDTGGVILPLCVPGFLN